MQIVLFLVILIVVAGFTAAAGDRMGHKAARRKIRMGKLRPRTVSTMIAVITGILISVLSFTILFLIWADFRNAMLNYQETKDELTAVTGELAASQQRLDEVAGLVAAANAETAQATQERDAALEITQQAQAEKIELVANVSDLNNQLDSIQGEIGRLKAERGKLAADIAAKEEQYGNLNDMTKTLFEKLTETEQIKQGDVIYTAGQQLVRKLIPAAAAQNPRPLIAAAMAEATEDAASHDITFDEESLAGADELEAAYRLQEVDEDTFLVISSIYNVVEGAEASLSFDVTSVATVIPEGDVIMEVVVRNETARISMQGAGLRQVEVPLEFTYDNLSAFLWEVHQHFVSGLTELEFMPEPDGGFSSPVLKLADHAEELMNFERPFTIRFIAHKNLHIMDSLEDSELELAPLDAPQLPAGNH